MQQMQKLKRKDKKPRGAATLYTIPPLRRFWHTNLNLKQSNGMKQHKATIKKSQEQQQKQRQQQKTT